MRMRTADIEHLANAKASDAWQVAFKQAQRDGLDVDEAVAIADPVAAATYDAEWDRLEAINLAAHTADKE